MCGTRHHSVRAFYYLVQSPFFPLIITTECQFCIDEGIFYIDQKGDEDCLHSRSANFEAIGSEAIFDLVVRLSWNKARLSQERL